ncbi:hypothetical protein GCM10022214_67810 [Actinomadura miaoliensis]|uniref:Uncharacterized protein n=1 Tax=Actinomadura miaoliensis TaxID=430685 RepID=A0ABP7WRQ2_9ACTN
MADLGDRMHPQPARVGEGHRRREAVHCQRVGAGSQGRVRPVGWRAVRQVHTVGRGGEVGGDRLSPGG